MANWRHRVKIRHLFVTEEDHASIQKSMNSIADVLEKDSWFREFHYLEDFHSIPEGDHILGPIAYANQLIDMLYDFCDENLIWIELD